MTRGSVLYSDQTLSKARLWKIGSIVKVSSWKYCSPPVVYVAAMRKSCRHEIAVKHTQRLACAMHAVMRNLQLLVLLHLSGELP